ncbi:gamma-secretase subunit pen-2 [Agrilus planipennis]|uniref:Gamma-secretase subunit PEN-2 n=1 Tax=Agrilus planipennis TaxID=224129 RepID=A0A1W4XNF0_AGRPL|nr:gamma-secretase subunit pen-2 [Agrilus planipennis]
MDLAKMSHPNKLCLCKWYFKAGFALLPFLWAINSIWFFKEAFYKPPFEEQKDIKKFVVLSAVGTLVWIIIVIGWVLTFQLNRAKWGEFADDISFIIPLGRP